MLVILATGLCLCICVSVCLCVWPMQVLYRNGCILTSWFLPYGLPSLCFKDIGVFTKIMKLPCRKLWTLKISSRNVHRRRVRQTNKRSLSICCWQHLATTADAAKCCQPSTDNRQLLTTLSVQLCMYSVIGWLDGTQVVVVVARIRQR